MIAGPSHGGVPLCVTLCSIAEGTGSAGEQDLRKQRWWRIEFKAIQERFQAALRQYEDLGDKGCRFEVEFRSGGDTARNPKVTIVALIPRSYPASRPKMLVTDRYGDVPRKIMEQLTRCLHGVTTQVEAAAGPSVFLALQHAEHLLDSMRNNSSASVCHENLCEELGKMLPRQPPQRGGSQGCLILPIVRLESNNIVGAFVGIPAGGAFHLMTQASTVLSPPGTCSAPEQRSSESSCSPRFRATEVSATSTTSTTSTVCVPLKPPGKWSMGASCVSSKSNISKAEPTSVTAPLRPPGSWSNQIEELIVNDLSPVPTPDQMPAPITHLQCVVNENTHARPLQLRTITHSKARLSGSTCSTVNPEVFEEDPSDSSSDDDSSADSDEEASGSDQTTCRLIQEELRQNMYERVAEKRQMQLGSKVKLALEEHVVRP